MQRTIRVLHVGLSSNTGGIETVVHSWFCNKPDYVQFDFINVEKKPLAYEDEFLKQGKIYNIPARRDNPYMMRRRLREIIEEGQYDYMHHHVMSLSWMDPAEIAFRNGRTIPVLHGHCIVDKHISRKYRLLHKIGERQLCGIKCEKLACCNEAGESMFYKQPYEVIENGIETDKFSYSDTKRNAIRTKYKISDDEFVIGHVGRPGAQKNYPFILKTFSLLRKKNRNVKLLLIGNINNDPDIQNLIGLYRLKESVILTGKVQDTSKYYSAMDIFFFPSLYEGLSVALVEAQASGLRCVAGKNISGESDVSGLVTFIDIDDAQKAADVLTQFLEQPRYDRTVCKIPSSYDIKESSKKIFRFYNSHIQSRRGKISGQI
jgi:glycosyltransferase involved in cell wall biosynthesis